MIVVFDLGKVLLDFDLPKISHGLAALCAMPEPEIATFLFENELSHAHDRGDLSSEQFFQRIKDRLNLSISFAQFKPIWNEIFTPIPGMEEVVASLKKNYRIGLLSNTNKLHFDYIAATYPVVRGMDWHLSYELRMMKPDPAIYKTVADFYNVEPDDIFYADDLANNVVGAAAAGFQAVQFTSTQQYLRDLAKAGITL